MPCISVPPLSAAAGRNMPALSAPMPRPSACPALLVGAFPEVLRQHRDFADDGRQFAVSRSVEGELDVALA
jgi:hypothetical protein